MEENIQQDDQVGMSNLNNIEQQLEAANNNYKRVLADFENYKRRKENENKELVEFAREVTVAKLLPTLDSLGQALKHMPEHQPAADSKQQADFAKAYQNWQGGIGGILSQLDKTLAELGVKKIEAVGKKFDPNFHEAVREAESEQDDGVIIEEFQTGFELNGKVIRPSQVVISKKATKGGE